MALTYVDQCIWPELHVSTGGVTAQYVLGGLLPAASTAADVAVRNNLITAGALRHVTAAGASGDVAGAAVTIGGTAQKREGALWATPLTEAKPVIVSPAATLVLNY